MDTFKCLKCGETKDLDSFPKKDGRLKRFVCYTCIGKKERAKLKIDMLNALGWQCACCGEKNVLFLTLDHVKNDGAQHREENNYQCQQVLYAARREGWPKDKYQVLCYNCNCVKGFFGICPHQQNITPEQSVLNLLATFEGVGNEHVPKNTSNIADARKSRMDKLIASGYTGPKTSAQKSKDYREKHPEYKDRKKVYRDIGKLTPDEAMKLIEMLSQKVVKQ